MANLTGKGGFKKGVSGNPKGRKITLDGTDPSILVLNTGNVVRQSPRVDQTLRKTKPYIFFGKDNLFPQKLIRMYDNVNTHRQQINKLVRLIAGKGFSYEGTAATQAQEFVETATGGNVNKWLKKVSFDDYMFNGFYLNILYTRDGKIDRFPHLDFSTGRSSLIDIETRKVPSYWVSADWEQATKKNNFDSERTELFRPFEIPRFDPLAFKDAEAKPHGQLWLVEDTIGSAGKLYYPEPTYMGALTWIDVASKLADFHKNNLDNGMVGSMHIHLYEDLSDPAKRRKVETRLNEKYGGSNNAGSIVLTWSTTSGKEPIMNSLPVNNSHEMGKLLDDITNAEILKAHDVPNILANVDTPTGLGGQAPAIRHNLNMLQATTIQDFQERITGAVNKILTINEIDAEVNIIDRMPVNFLVQDERLLFEVLGRERFMKDFLRIEFTEQDDVKTDIVDDNENDD